MTIFRLFIPLSAFRRRLVLWCLLPACLLSAQPDATAQKTPLAVLEKNTPLNATADPAVRNRLAAADEALAAGLTELAAGIYTALAKDIPQYPALLEHVQIARATCLLERDNAVAALKILEPLPSSPARQIRLVIARVILGIQIGADETLNTITPALLAADDVPWYHLARALAALATDNPDNYPFIQAEFAQVRAQYTADAQHYQAQHVQMLEYLARLKIGPPPTDVEIAQLRQSMALHENDPLGFKFAKELAIALHKNERSGEAVGVLRQRSFLPPAERDEADLLTGFILGAAKPKGREALLNLIVNKAQPDLQLLALQQLVGVVMADPLPPDTGAVAKEIYESLTRLAATAPDSRTLDEIHLARARIMAAVHAYPQAERAAYDLLTRIPAPASNLRAGALRILAVTAWQTGAVRRAADHLTQLQSLMTGPAQIATARRAADCLFLSAQGPTGDTAAYPLAAAAYEAVQRSLPTPEERGNALFLRIQCELLSGNGDNAAKILATASTTTATASVDIASIHRGEWALIEWLRARNRAPEAAARLVAIFKHYPDMSTAYRIRFHWQQALIAIATGDTAGAAALATQLATIVENLPPTTSPGLLDQRQTILSKVTLLKARAVLAADAAAATHTFTELRLKFPDEEATAASYLVEGRDLAAREEHDKALQVFLDAHRHYSRPNLPPNLGEYAAEALFEAAGQHIALAKKDPGATANYRNAIETLERFLTEHPAHPLATAARLQQADIFRTTADFDDALDRYKQLIPSLADTPDRWRAELGQADCLFAKAVNHPSARPSADGTATTDPTVLNTNLNLAIAAYANLFNLPGKSPDLKAEAGYKWSLALATRQPDPQGSGITRGDIAREADETRWQVVNQTFGDTALAAGLGPTGRHWVARTIMDLAASLNARGLVAAAANTYRLLLDYNRDTANTPERVLPFQNIAKSELAKLGQPPQNTTTDKNTTR
ncbi:MAG: hypothetical protein LBV28_01540 [Puniceicoccales bacterium]|nr:hypothetical protein [Puniceicoccales bacterium]